MAVLECLILSKGQWFWVHLQYKNSRITILIFYNRSWFDSFWEFPIGNFCDLIWWHIIRSFSSDSWIALQLICLFYVCGNLLFGCFCKNLWYLINQNLFHVRPGVFIGLMPLQTLPCHMCIPNGWQVTFVMLSLGFCLLSKSPSPTPCS